MFKKLKKFKKIVLSSLLVFATVVAFAIPGGCYSGTSRTNRDRCAIHIGGNTLSVMNRNGDVVARWNIVKDNNGVLTLKSEYGATATASWWKEDGKVYLNFNYETFTLM
jgi:hypothetical protein